MNNYFYVSEKKMIVINVMTQQKYILYLYLIANVQVRQIKVKIRYEFL